MIKLKKTGIIFVVFTLCFAVLCGCNNTEKTLSSSFSPDSSASKETVSEPESSVSDNTETEQSSIAESASSVVSSVPQVSSSRPAVSSAPTSSVAVSSSQKAPSSAPSSSTPTAATTTSIPMYTVNDPNNTRGLNNTQIGVDYGTPTNDTPPQKSIDNQQRCDAMSGVESLWVDTKTTEKIMYLTFDCGYEYQNLTGKILDTLKQKNVKAAFFVTLSYLKKNPQFVRRMINEGHIVGNHSVTHPNFPSISRTKMAEELYLVDEYLQKNFNYKPKYFRFPSGNHSHNSLELVTSVGYKSIFWSVAYADWNTSQQKGAQHAYNTVTPMFHPGAVILLHAVSSDNAAALGNIIDNAHSRGYKFVSLNDYYK